MRPVSAEYGGSGRAGRGRVAGRAVDGRGAGAAAAGFARQLEPVHAAWVCMVRRLSATACMRTHAHVQARLVDHPLLRGMAVGGGSAVQAWWLLTLTACRLAERRVRNFRDTQPLLRCARTLLKHA